MAFGFKLPGLGAGKAAAAAPMTVSAEMPGSADKKLALPGFLAG